MNRRLNRIIKESVRKSLHEAMSMQDNKKALNDLAYEMFGMSFEDFYRDMGFLASPIKFEKFSRYWDEVKRRGLLS